MIQPLSSSFLSNPFVHPTHPPGSLAKMRVLQLMTDQLNSLYPNPNKLECLFYSELLLFFFAHLSGSRASSNFPSRILSLSAPSVPYRNRYLMHVGTCSSAHILASAPTDWLHEIPVYAPIRPSLPSSARSLVLFFYLSEIPICAKQLMQSCKKPSELPPLCALTSAILQKRSDKPSCFR